MLLMLPRPNRPQGIELYYDRAKITAGQTTVKSLSCLQPATAKPVTRAQTLANHVPKPVTTALNQCISTGSMPCSRSHPGLNLGSFRRENRRSPQSRTTERFPHRGDQIL